MENNKKKVSFDLTKNETAIYKIDPGNSLKSLKTENKKPPTEREIKIEEIAAQIENLRAKMESLEAEKKSLEAEKKSSEVETSSLGSSTSSLESFGEIEGSLSSFDYFAPGMDSSSSFDKFNPGLDSSSSFGLDGSSSSEPEKTNGLSSNSKTADVNNSPNRIAEGDKKPVMPSRASSYERRTSVGSNAPVMPKRQGSLRDKSLSNSRKPERQGSLRDDQQPRQGDNTPEIGSPRKNQSIGERVDMGAFGKPQNKQLSSAAPSQRPTKKTQEVRSSKRPSL